MDEGERRTSSDEYKWFLAKGMTVNDIDLKYDSENNLVRSIDLADKHWDEAFYAETFATVS